MSTLPRRLNLILQKFNPFSNSAPVITHNPTPTLPIPEPSAPILPPIPKPFTASYLDPITRKHAIDGLIARAIKTRRKKYSHYLRSAVHVRRQLASSDFRNATAFYPILKWLQRLGDTSTMWRVVDVMRAWGIDPDPETLNYIVQAYLQTEGYDDVMEVLLKKGFSPNSQTYHEMVERACHARDLGRALWFLWRMEEAGVQVLSRTHKAVVFEMMRRMWYADVLKYVRKVCEKDKEMGAHICWILAKAHIRCGRVGKARQVVEEMVNLGLPVSKKLADFIPKVNSEL